MGFTEREIKHDKLEFKIFPDNVKIGENFIQKTIYYKHKKVFDAIIESNDSSWNTPFHYLELTKFLKDLEENKMGGMVL